MIKSILKQIKGCFLAFISSVGNIIFLTAIILLAWQNFNLTNKLEYSKNNLESKHGELVKKVNDIETVLLSAQEKSTTLEEALATAEEKSKKLEKEFKKVNDNVDELEKITTTDPELLQKYSKIFFLNEHYVPEDLTTIPSKYTYESKREYEIHSEVWPHLQELLDDAKDDNVDLQIISAFRSFGEQAQLKGAYTVVYGAGTANQFSADQGYSEHQLGTAVDFTNTQVGSTFSGFAQSKEYKWLQDNAHKYGFTLSYPENNKYYEFEPWHWRFVGEDLADDLHDDGKYFYDISQREIDDYISKLFD